MSEKIKEEVKFYTEWLKLLTITIVADIAGVISLIRIEKNTAIESVLIVFGFFSILALATATGWMSYRTKE